MNLEQARFNMIEQQIRTWDVLDPRVLDVMRKVPREDFVPARHRKLAFSDLRIPLGNDQVKEPGHQQFMMKPIEQGRMLQGLQLEGHEHVLEVGTGSGYLTACLSQLASKVTSIEISKNLSEQASKNLKELDLEQLELQHGDVLQAQYDEDTFDAILVSASVASVPECFSRWLRKDGRLLIILGQAPAMEAVVLTRSTDRRWQTESLFETDIPRLLGAEDAAKFVF